PVLEVVVLEVGNRVGHVVLAGQERLLPGDGAVAPDTARPAQVPRQFTYEEFWTERRLPELGMGEPQVVVPLGHVIRELVGKAEAETEGSAVGADHIDPGQLRLFAPVARESGTRERLIRPDEVIPVALVE